MEVSRLYIQSLLLTSFVISLDQIFKAGAAHGAQSADVYGCLYFFLSDQLRKFTRRIRELDILFQLTNFDARALSQGIRDDVFSSFAIPASLRFDRIHVSNVFDANYIGISGVLSDWAPLLAKGETAAIIGYFMNWVAVQENGRAMSAGPKVLKMLLDRLLEEGKVGVISPYHVFRKLTVCEYSALWQASKPEI